MNNLKLKINGEYVMVAEADAPAIINDEIARLERCRKLEIWMENRHRYIQRKRQERRIRNSYK
jgi:hypothetical protein